MCGQKLNRTCLALALLCLPLWATSPEPVYEITETELAELEQILTEQQEKIERQEHTLTELLKTTETQRQLLGTLSTTLTQQRDTLTTLSGTIAAQQTTIDALRISSQEYASATRMRLWRTSAISIGVGTLVGLIIGITAF